MWTSIMLDRFYPVLNGWAARRDSDLHTGVQNGR